VKNFKFVISALIIFFFFKNLKAIEKKFKEDKKIKTFLFAENVSNNTIKRDRKVEERKKILEEKKI